MFTLKHKSEGENAPKTILGLKSDKMRGKPSNHTTEPPVKPAPPRKVNILPSKIALKSDSPPENGGKLPELTSKTLEKGQKLPPKSENSRDPPSPHPTDTKKTPTNPVVEKTSETTNLAKKNVFQILKWPPKSQELKVKTKQTKQKTKPENKQPENLGNQSKITSM